MEADLKCMLEEILALLKKSPFRSRSSEINLIMQALSKAQGEYKPLIANEESPGGDYANLEAILSSTRESLSKYEISFFQLIDLLEDGTGASLLRTIVGHSSGQFLSSTARIVASNTNRDTGRMLEFHKRMHALLLLGIAPSENDPFFKDDNGEEQATEHLIESVMKPKDKKKTEKIDTISKVEHHQLLFELHDMEDVTKDIMKTYDIQTIADLPKSEYFRVLAQIRRIKKAEDEYLKNNKS